MSERTSPRVAIIGSGPAGLALAIELGSRGVPCVVLERSARAGHAPRAKTTNVRTREHLRRWGIAGDLAAASPFGVDYPSDVLFVTSLAGKLIHRFENALNCRPDRDDRYSEHAQWIPQYKLEGVLRAHARVAAGRHDRLRSGVRSASPRTTTASRVRILDHAAGTSGRLPSIIWSAPTARAARCATPSARRWSGATACRATTTRSSARRAWPTAHGHGPGDHVLAAQQRCAEPDRADGHARPVVLHADRSARRRHLRRRHGCVGADPPVDRHRPALRDPRRPTTGSRSRLLADRYSDGPRVPGRRRVPPPPAVRRLRHEHGRRRRRRSRLEARGGAAGLGRRRAARQLRSRAPLRPRRTSWTRRRQPRADPVDAAPPGPRRRTPAGGGARAPRPARSSRPAQGGASSTRSASCSAIAMRHRRSSSTTARWPTGRGRATMCPSAIPGCLAPHAWLADGGRCTTTFGPGFTLLAFGDAGAGDAVAEAHAAGVPLDRRRLPARSSQRSTRHRWR